MTFWDKYPSTCPRKNNKKGCRDKFIQIVSKEITAVDDIMDGLEKAISCRQWQQESGKFIPSPMVFLNQERWLDDYDTADISVTEKMEGLGL